MDVEEGQQSQRPKGYGTDNPSFELHTAAQLNLFHSYLLAHKDSKSLETFDDNEDEDYTDHEAQLSYYDSVLPLEQDSQESWNVLQTRESVHDELRRILMELVAKLKDVETAIPDQEVLFVSEEDGGLLSDIDREVYVFFTTTRLSSRVRDHVTT